MDDKKGCDLGHPFLARFLLTGLAVTQGLIALKIDCLLPPA
jgi:hypothetical protein